MLISAGRALTRTFMRLGDDPTYYSYAQTDYGMQVACDEVIRRCYLLPKQDTVTLTANTAALPAMPTNFYPDRLMEAYLSGSNVQINPGWLDPNFRYMTVGAPTYWDTNPSTAKLTVVDYVTYINQNAAATATGQPVMMAFSNWMPTTGVTGSVYPTPDQNYTLNLRWLDLFTSWTPGVPLVYATLSSGAIATLTLTSPGDSTYTAAPTVTISGGGGTGATATSTLQGVPVQNVTMTNNGSGYTAAPAVTFSGGGGSGATATAILQGDTVQAITVTNAGNNYTSAPSVVINNSGTGGTGAAATSTISASVFALRSVTLTGAGSGFTSAPTISIAGVDCTDSTLNIPDHLLRQILLYGPQSKIPLSQPENQSVMKMAIEGFENTIQQLMGAGGMGTDAVFMNWRGGGWS